MLMNMIVVRAVAIKIGIDMKETAMDKVKQMIKEQEEINTHNRQVISGNQVHEVIHDEVEDAWDELDNLLGCYNE